MADSGEPAAKRVCVSAESAVETVPEAVDIAAALGVHVPGTRLEVLWDVQHDEGDEVATVWWPCEVVRRTDGCVKLPVELPGAPDSGAEHFVVVYEVRYDPIPEVILFSTRTQKHIIKNILKKTRTHHMLPSPQRK